MSVLQQHREVVAALSADDDAESQRLARFVLADHRPVHPTVEPGRWYCHAFWAHHGAAADPWPCQVFLDAQARTATRPGDVRGTDHTKETGDE